MRISDEFTSGNEIKHIAWSSIEEVSYCFSRSSIKFQGHTGQKIANFDPNLAFRTVTTVWIDQWLWNDAHNLQAWLLGLFRSRSSKPFAGQYFSQYALWRKLWRSIISPYSFSTFSWRMLWRILWRSIILHIHSPLFLHIFSIFISALWRKSGNEYGENIRLFSAFFHKKRSLNTPYYMEKKRKWMWRKFPLFSPLFLHNDFFPFSPLFLRFFPQKTESQYSHP